MVTVSAASFARGAQAVGSIVSAFGQSLATRIAEATGIPLPTALAGTTIRVVDNKGTERLAPLFFVAPSQVNYLKSRQPPKESGRSQLPHRSKPFLRIRESFSLHIRNFQTNSLKTGGCPLRRNKSRPTIAGHTACLRGHLRASCPRIVV
jgi:hypothetical protein